MRAFNLIACCLFVSGMLATSGIIFRSPPEMTLSIELPEKGKDVERSQSEDVKPHKTQHNLSSADGYTGPAANPQGVKISRQKRDANPGVSSGNRRNL